jgi:hypothetical protein
MQQAGPRGRFSSHRRGLKHDQSVGLSGDVILYGQTLKLAFSSGLWSRAMKRLQLSHQNRLLEGEYGYVRDTDGKR